MTRFVDVYVHPPPGAVVASGYGPYLPDGGFPDGPSGFDELADRYREQSGVALVHAFDAGSTLGATALSNRRLAEGIAQHGDVLVGLACVDPHRGEAAVVEVHDALRMGLRGLYLHPPAQRFDPTGRRFAPLWDLAEEMRIPVVVHCGTTFLGSGRPGGAGIALGVADPMRMDRVAAARPDLQIVLAGISPPWEGSASAVAVHKQNVSLALPGDPGSGLEAAASGRLSSKVMVGTGFPFGTPEAWLESWDRLGPDEEADRAVRVGNAAALFGL